MSPRGREPSTGWLIRWTLAPVDAHSGPARTSTGVPEYTRQFVDTNVLVYAVDATAGDKQVRAAELLRGLWMDRTGCVSVQVLLEFYVAVSRRLGAAATEVRRWVEDYGTWFVHSPSFQDVAEAIDLHERRQISVWDAMILQSARRMGCLIVWSEDLQHGSTYDGVQVGNPFATPTAAGAAGGSRGG